MGSPGIQQMPAPLHPPSSLSDHDLVRIATFLKEALKEEIHTLTNMEVDKKNINH